MSSSDAEATHISVLLDEILEIVDPQPDEVLVDATLGLGGHSKALLERQPRLRLIGLDQDAAAVENASKTLESFADRLTVVQTNFVNIRTAVTDLGLDRVDAIIADLGVSSLQFDSATRGFSFRFDAPLDMRMDADSDHPTAADLLESLSEEEIANVIYRYGEERHSRRIARRIVQRREAGNPARTTKDLAELVEKAVPRKPNDKIHPATRTFQALRIAVNEELDVLGKFIEDAVDLLAPGGRLAIISFHSLEDRIVKQAFIRLSGRCQCPPRMPVCQCGAVKKIEILTKKPVIPTEREARENPRSRSAKLRAVRKPTADNPKTEFRKEPIMKKFSRPLPAQESNPLWVYVLVTIACISFLALGFFFAARQHFMAMDLSIKNSRLRRQVEEMEGENRRLVLAREIVRSPSEVKRIAARRGLRNADEVFAPVTVSGQQHSTSALVQKTNMSVPKVKSDKPLKAFYGPSTKTVPKQSKAVSTTLIASSKLK